MRPRLKILVADDHAPFRRLICTSLQRRPDVETIEAADGLAAIQKAEELQPDVILLDVHLPKLNGFAVAERLLTLVPGARVLFLSQESAPDLVQEALRLGAQGYVQKLRAATDLMPAIDAALGAPRSGPRAPVR